MEDVFRRASRDYSEVPSVHLPIEVLFLLVTNYGGLASIVLELGLLESLNSSINAYSPVRSLSF